VDDDLRVAGRIENGPVLLVLVAQECGIDVVAVMGDRYLAAGIVDQQRLSIAGLT
jgi:phosphoribosylamine-glycine ligase